MNSPVHHILIGYVQLFIEREEKRQAQLKAAYDRWAEKNKSKSYNYKKKRVDVDILD
jgi:hypothetical protein